MEEAIGTGILTFHLFFSLRKSHPKIKLPIHSTSLSDPLIPLPQKSKVDSSMPTPSFFKSKRQEPDDAERSGNLPMEPLNLDPGRMCQLDKAVEFGKDLWPEKKALRLWDYGLLMGL